VAILSRLLREVGKRVRGKGKGLVFSLSPVGELVEPLTFSHKSAKNPREKSL